MVEDFQKPEMVTAVIPGSPTLSMEDFTTASESCPELFALNANTEGIYTQQEECSTSCHHSS